ncbi:hypothetical protein Afil01_28630 [Actinorhabdospora filicis]|uniref:Protein-L-isoaspartate O-methyltransferase n=2 Tax=Actinorhabdospora filicis TaxID=1785913 RepID=A0A9W6SNX6_9ACTN|nr:hypothetical protein Afil01_28630 [Actinorhabdospora filicis]
MAVMLGHLDITEEPVLEAGTGTGYNAAILSAHFGADRVVSVETDAEVAARAAAALDSTGVTPRLVIGDASAGHTPGGPYGGVIATYSVTRIPYAWVEQTRPGGILVVPLDTGLRRQFLTKLTVAADGTATGRVVGGVAFMRDRGQRVTSDDVPEIDGIETTTDLDPRDALYDHDANMFVAAHVRDVLTWTGDNDIMGAHIGLEDPTSGSWAHIGLTAPPRRVRQGGPRRLWDEIADAVLQWRDIGAPAATTATITVTANGQTIGY